jgi:K+ transporter
MHKPAFQSITNSRFFHVNHGVMVLLFAESLYWPIFVLATLSAMIASQAIITATFSIVKQSVALGCFPRVKVVHTSNNIAGQVYIPEVNWILMVLCLVITAGFRDTNEIGNAYGMHTCVITGWTLDSMQSIG